MEADTLRPRTLQSIAAGLVAFPLVVAMSASSAEPMRGLLVFGHEAGTFQPCGGNRVYWVDA